MSVSTTIGRYNINKYGVATKAPVTVETLPLEADDIIKKCGGDYEKIFYEIRSRVRYRFMEMDTVENMCVYSLNNGKGACYNYAALYQYIMSRAGYEIITINGIPHDGGVHYWNMVKMNGKWYHFDSCNNYFKVSDAFMKDRYSWDYDAFPTTG